MSRVFAGPGAGPSAGEQSRDMAALDTLMRNEQQFVLATTPLSAAEKAARALARAGRRLVWSRARSAAATGSGGETLPLCRVSHSLRGQDTAFALCFHYLCG